MPLRSPHRHLRLLDRSRSSCIAIVVRPFVLTVVIVGCLFVPLGCDRHQNVAAYPDVFHPGVVGNDASVDYVSHRPQGWRRTKDGWQHTSDWASGALGQLTLNEQIARQKKMEPLWIQHGLTTVRSFSPLTVAMFQIALIGLIARASIRAKQTANAARSGIVQPEDQA